MSYKYTNITEPQSFEVPSSVRIHSDLSMVATLSGVPTSPCGIVSISPQRTLGVDKDGHLCYWYYDGESNRTLRDQNTLSSYGGTSIVVGAIHSHSGVKLYVNGAKVAHVESPLWSKDYPLSYMGTYGVSPSEYACDVTIDGALVVDYVMSDDLMSVVNYDTRLCAIGNILYHVPSKSVMHLSAVESTGLSNGSVYAYEEDSTWVISNSPMYPCWYLGEYDSTTGDVFLNIGERMDGGDSARIESMDMMYYCSNVAVSDPSSITNWGSSYDDTYSYIYVKYTITYKDEKVESFVTRLVDPTKSQYKIYTLACYVDDASETASVWSTSPMVEGVSFVQNAEEGHYQHSREWTWFGEEFTGYETFTYGDSYPNGFAEGHWVSGSARVELKLSEEYIKDLMVVEDVVSKTVKDYAEDNGIELSTIMGNKMLPKDISGGYALQDETGSLQAKNCYLEEIKADGFETSTYGSTSAWTRHIFSEWGYLVTLLRTVEGLEVGRNLPIEGSVILSDDSTSYTFEGDKDYITDRGVSSIRWDGLSTFYLNNWFSIPTSGITIDVFKDFLGDFINDITLANQTQRDSYIENLYGRIYIQVTDSDGGTWTYATGVAGYPKLEYGLNPDASIRTSYYPVFNSLTVTTPSGMRLGGAKVLFRKSLNTITIHLMDAHYRDLADTLGIPKYITVGSIVSIFPVTTYSDIGESYVNSIRWQRPNGTIDPMYTYGVTDITLDSSANQGIVVCSYKRLDNREKVSYNNTFTKDPNGQIQTYGTVGQIVARAVIPYGSSADDYVRERGATLGTTSRLWDNVWTKGITDGTGVLLKPLESANKATVMRLFGGYALLWGTATYDSYGVATLNYPLGVHNLDGDPYFVLTSGPPKIDIGKNSSNLLVLKNSSDTSTEVDCLVIAKFNYVE